MFYLRVWSRLGFGRLAQIELSQAVEEAVIFWPGTPVELQLRQGLAWHTRLLTKPGRQTMPGPIIRHNSGRSNRMSQPEPLVRRFNLTSLLRNRQANAPVISESKSKE